MLRRDVGRGIFQMDDRLPRRQGCSFALPPETPKSAKNGASTRHDQRGTSTLFLDFLSEAKRDKRNFSFLFERAILEKIARGWDKGVL